MSGSRSHPVPASEIGQQLRRAGISGVDDSALARSLYSSDASLYRVAPLAVVTPKHPDELEAILEVCRVGGVPITARGAGTSIAGNAVGPGVVIDTSRHLTSVRIQPEERTAVVGPGIVQAVLQHAAAPHGLRFGPDPSTHNRCTIGGMIGNNACGARALGYGRTVDNVVALDVVTGAGERLTVASPAAASAGGSAAGSALHQSLLGQATPTGTRAALGELVAGELATVRTQFGQFSRQGSGYSLEHLLPERGVDLARFLAGTEGTLALIREATVALVADAPVRLMVALGYDSMADAADAVGQVLPFGPTACEGMDLRIVDRMRERSPDGLPALPRGNGWLLVELVGDDPAEVRDRADRLAGSAGALDAMVVTDPAHAAAVWRIREDGAGLASRTADGRQAYSGWEDAAVPVEHLGTYLRQFDALLADHGVTGVPYGHFGDGCVHVRIDFPLGRGADRGRGAFRAFLDDAADLVAGHGGSMSGEHGDGRARSALLPKMFSPEAIALMGRVKALLDPQNLLNPGVLVAPDQPEDHLRTSTVRTEPITFSLAHGENAEDFGAAVHRCTGVGKCRAEVTGAVMCPSFQATADEKDSTRGRARVLQELMQRSSATSGEVDWAAPHVHEALDLCLSCKGCSRDCPTGVDMASLKSQVLYNTYRPGSGTGRRRPIAHLTLGRLPQWADLVAKAPGLVNAVLRFPLTARGSALAGVDPRRTLPQFADRTFHQVWRARRADRAGDTGESAPNGTVALWADTFTDHFGPEVAVATVRVLERAGYRVELVSDEACCGLTWISTGQLDQARAKMTRTVQILDRHLAAGHRLVAVEPSCLAAVRQDGPALVRSADGSIDPAARRVAGALASLAELLRATPGWSAPDLTGVQVVAQPHCHHHAVLGWDTDAALLREAGAQVTRVSGCCGLAGNWGAELGHHDLSMQIAEQNLLPAVRALDVDGVVLADGFSCRTQLAQGFDEGRAPRHTVAHLAQLLDRADTDPGVGPAR